MAVQGIWYFTRVRNPYHVHITLVGLSCRWPVPLHAQAPLLTVEAELKRLLRPMGLTPGPWVARGLVQLIFNAMMATLWNPPMVATGMVAGMVAEGDGAVAAVRAAAVAAAGRGRVWVAEAAGAAVGV